MRGSPWPGSTCSQGWRALPAAAMNCCHECTNRYSKARTFARTAFFNLHGSKKQNRPGARHVASSAKLTHMGAAD